MMKRRCLSIVLMLCMVLTLVPATVLRANAVQTNGVCGEQLTWALDSEGTLTITGTGSMTDYSNSDYPWNESHNKVKNVVIANGVTSIGRCAFYWCTNLPSISIPNSVTSIGEFAFCKCTSLTNITIPNNVTSIGKNAFSECSGLTSVTLSNNTTSIGDGAFSLCTNLTSIDIPDGVTSIGQGTFSNCTSLANVTIPNSVISIGSSAFYKCTSLTKLDIPDSVTTIAPLAFSRCTGLTTIKLPYGVKSIGNNVFAGCSNLASIVIPNSVTNIGIGIFEECTSLSKVTIPDSVSSLESRMFYGCTGLTSVAIPNSVTSISPYAFTGCDKLTDVYYSGTEADWNRITVEEGNDELLDATIHFNSSGLPSEQPGGDNEGKITIVSSSPENGSETVSTDDEFVLTFNREINRNFNWENGSIRIVNYETDETAFVIDSKQFYALGGFVSGKAVSITDRPFRTLAPGKYYFLIDKDVISASESNSDGTFSTFAGISDKDELVFTIPSSTIIEVPSTTFTTSFNGKSESVEWNDGWFQYPASTYIHKLAIASAALRQYRTGKKVQYSAL